MRRTLFSVAAMIRAPHMNKVDDVDKIVPPLATMVSGVQQKKDREKKRDRYIMERLTAPVVTLPPTSLDG